MLFSICYIRSLQSGSKVSRFRRLAQRSKGAQQPKTQSLKDRLRCIIDAWLHTSVILCVCLCVKLDLLDFDTWAFLRTCHGSIPMISMMNPRKRMRWLHLTRCLSWAPAPASSSNLVTPQCKGDQRLKNIKLQMADWDSLQTPVKQRENHVKSLAEELKKAMDEAKGTSVKESALVPGQLPDHVT